MKSIFITGSTGFVGKNLISKFDSKYSIFKYEKNTPISINHDIVIHLAGKAHDLRKVAIPEEYYKVNTELTKKVFDSFLSSRASIFIVLSSVKAVADEVEGELTEETIPNPQTHYGKSKLLAEQYIFSKPIPKGKKVFILRPCMIHGPGNKGNLNLLIKLVKLRIPWPFLAFINKRSLCGIYNLCFVIDKLINSNNIPSGIYNVADKEIISTMRIIEIISETLRIKLIKFYIPKWIIIALARICGVFNFSFNMENLTKLTSSYIVNCSKINNVISDDYPFSTEGSLKNTINSINND